MIQGMLLVYVCMFIGIKFSIASITPIYGANLWKEQESVYGEQSCQDFLWLSAYSRKKMFFYYFEGEGGWRELLDFRIFQDYSILLCTQHVEQPSDLQENISSTSSFIKYSICFYILEAALIILTYLNFLSRLTLRPMKYPIDCLLCPS